ncbi:YbaB/EbfC family nucleoid-associated protein [Pseudostreptobacillus hongkongensis]|uniref:YbaB/EbfC family nucleoid-associated protein n=1 Tax=Pseudostreptobacillus hongkongensis TaxID=1162717 RepID=UPI00083311DC|nr:YbaB/EbfC family nucleoid-associated protein [Pseudostreptobacillus hongkongensis]
MVRKLKGASNSNSQSDIIKRAQVMQERMLAIQEELKDKFVEESVAGGAVVVKANGQKDIVDLVISKDIVADAVEDTSELTSLILSAINGAMNKAEELAEKEMSVVTGGVSIPGLF